MEYGTDPLHRSHSFPEWSSSEPEDATFGATLIEGKTPKRASEFLQTRPIWKECLYDI